MSNINAQAKTLNDIAGVQELSNEAAAIVQGGALVDVYKHHDANGYPYEWLGSANKSSKWQLSPGADNQISGIVVRGGHWRFYDLPGFDEQGDYFDITEPGTYYLGGYFMNDRISSFKRIDV
jgi:hypothetical protein